MNGIMGCQEKLRDKHIIPFVPVNTTIKLNLGGENELMWKNNPKYFSISTPNADPIGYNGHGIVIFTEDAREFHCFDATCTNCPYLDSHFTQKDLKVNIATCPKCGTEFSLLYGQPFGNSSKIYPLKEYPIQRNGDLLIVSYN